jgi:hypothetical protein
MASTSALAAKKRSRSRPAKAKQGAREHQRVSVAAAGELVSLEGHRAILVVNLCEQGAMVEVTMPPQLGSEVLLYFGDVEAEGAVVWRGPEHCGIRFHEPIRQEEVDCEALWSRKLLDHILAK